jgi:DNA-binding GntR family transcriptional regulator
MPRYLQLAQCIEAALQRDEWISGDRLPSDAELAATYGVNRHTVARALEHLQSKGLVARVKGHGTFVSPGRLEYRLAADMSFSNSVARLGLRNSQRVLALEQRTADPEVAAELRLPEGASVVTLERLRFAGQVPLALLRKHYAEAVFPGLRDHLAGKFLSTRELIRRHYDLELKRARSAIEIQPADVRLARALSVPVSTPLLLITSLDTLVDGTPAECGHAYFRGDAARVRVTLDDT